MKKSLCRVILLILILALGISILAGCGAGSKDQQTGKSESQQGGTENKQSETTGSAGSDSYFAINGKAPEEVTGKILFWNWDANEFDMMKSMNSIYPKIEFEFVNVSFDDYMMKLQAALASGADIPDVLTMDIMFLGKFLTLGVADDIGSAPYNIDKSLMLDYLAEVATDENGVLRAVPNIPTPSALYYRRDLAKEYFGTDDPEVIGQKVKDWDTFIATGKELIEKSGGKVFMIPGVDALAQPYVYNQTAKPWLDGNKLLVEENYTDRFKLIEKIRDAKIDAGLDVDSPAFNASFAEGKVFCYPGVMWYQKYVVEANDPEGAGNWAITHVPEKPHFWGGIFWGAYNGSKNKEAVAAYLRYQLSMEGAKAKYDILHYIPPYKPAYEEDFLYEPNEYLGGQNTTEFYLEVMKNIEVRPPAINDQTFHELVLHYTRAIAKNACTAEEAAAQIEQELIEKFPEYTK